MGALPVGTVTLLLGDIEDSTFLWEQRDDEMPAALAELNAVIDETVAGHDGARPVEQGEGDSFVAGFARASDAVACAFSLQAATLSSGFLRLRMGLHTGEVQLRDGSNYMGPDVNRAARIRDVAHGGQILLSSTTAALAGAHLPAECSLFDLGSVELRGLDQPAPIFQLRHPELPTEAAPRQAPGAVRTNLPAQLTSFVGRVDDTLHVDRLLHDVRVVTLTGAGGAGKTRLAIHVAEGRLGRHRAGVWFVDLSRYNETDAALAGVAEAIGCARTTGLSVDVVARFIRDSERLIVLDNCEHLIAFAASLADGLLRACPNLTILATSREPLGVAGEATFRVPSLAAPHAEDLPAVEVAEFDAVRLFLERATRAKPDFRLDGSTAQAVVEICHRLEGLPLAIELAAARMRALTPQQILEGLHNRFRLLTGGARTTIARQQTLQASVDWSYGLLLDVERTVLNRLSVFAGGFDLDAAEAVCAGGVVEAHHILDIVLHLVDKSLVNADGDRFDLLETVRQYAAARLADSGEADAVRARHYDYFYRAVRLRQAVGEAEDGYRAVIESDYENIRRALQWAAEQTEPIVLARFASRLAPYWLTSTCMVDGVRWMREVIEREADPARKGLALARLGTLLTRSGDYSSDTAARDKGLALLRESGDRALLAAALSISIPTPNSLAELEALAAELGTPQLKVAAAFWRAFVTMQTDPAAAAAMAVDIAPLSRQAGMDWIELSARSLLAVAPVFLGEVAAAISDVESMVAEARDRGEGLLLVTGLTDAALLYELTGERPKCDAALAEIEALGEAVIVAPMPYFPETNCRSLVAMLRAEWDEALEFLTQQLAAPLRAGDRAGALRLMAVVEAVTGRHAEAAGHVVESDALDAGDEVAFMGFVPRDLAGAISARANGEWNRAEELAQVAIGETHARLIWAHWPVVTVLLLADIWSRRGRHEDAIRLLAGVRAETDRKGVVWETPLFTAMRGDAHERCREALGGERFAEVWSEGQMAWDDVVAFAQRGRGPRQRPDVGWDALTPTERQVAELVVAGATNKEVAEKLFMSVATVKTHLTRVYAKVGVSTRGQLAARVP